MVFYLNERIGLFIDGANIFATAKSVGLSVDYRLLLTFFRAQAHVVRASYYTVV